MGATVLLGFAEALAAPEAIFSLLDAGYTVRVFSRAGARPLAASRLPVEAAIEVPAPETDAEGCVAALRAAAASGQGIDVALAADDPSLWALNAAFGDATHPRLASARGAQARLALDKTIQLRLAEKAGLATPPTVVLERPEDVEQVRAFPAIVKPGLAMALEDGRLRRGEAVYLAAAADATAGRLAGMMFPALAQPLLAGVGEGLFGFAGAEGVYAWSAHRRMRMMNPHGSGASACRTAPVDPALRAAAERMIRAADWRGPFMLEFLRGEDGVAYFMELNGRLWGSLALARRAGCEHPAWAVAQAFDAEFAPPEPPPYRDIELRHLGRDLLHLAFVLRGPKTAFHKRRWPAFWPAAQAVLRPARATSFYNHDGRRPRFFLADAMDTVKRQLGRRR